MRLNIYKLSQSSCVAFGLCFGATGLAHADDYAFLDRERAPLKAYANSIRKRAKPTYTDSNVIGEITEVTGQAKIIRADGSEDPITLGTEVYEGDIVETEGAAAVNIGFVDETSFSVKKDSRIAIDEFVYDPTPLQQDHSVLRGVFMYTSGLIGREDPDKIEIDEVKGGIGIRG